MLNSRDLLVCFLALQYQRAALQAKQDKTPTLPTRWKIEQLDRTIESVKNRIGMFLEQAA